MSRAFLHPFNVRRYVILDGRFRIYRQAARVTGIGVAIGARQVFANNVGDGFVGRSTVVLCLCQAIVGYGPNVYLAYVSEGAVR